MATPVSYLYAAVVKAAAVESNLPMLMEAERASGVDLRQVRGFKGRNLLHLAVEGSCVTGVLDVCRYLVEEKGFPANSTSAEGAVAGLKIVKVMADKLESDVDAIHRQGTVAKSSFDSDQKEVISPREQGINAGQYQQGTDELETENIT